MIIIKTAEEIQKLREGGAILAHIIRTLSASIQPGITTKSLDETCMQLIKENGCTPALLGYRPEGMKIPYPASICISVNDEIVHGIPGERVLKVGDIVSLDLVIGYKGVFVDHTMTVPVGEISKGDKELLAVTQEALAVAIEAIVPGATTGDIGAAIESYVKPYKLGIVRGLAGHGVGRKIHEDPYVPNYGRHGRGEKLVPGMVIAIEPMLSRGSEDIVVLPDEYTIVTVDHSRAAHFEHTVLIGENGYPETLTKE